jgi:hypothetical protein
MADSKIQICNQALSLLGADAIRSFDENNKRARMCDVFFESTRNYLLTKFDWPFARKYAKLQLLAEEIVPADKYAYQLPNDCMIPRDLHPPGSYDPWSVHGRVLWCNISSEQEVFLYYTIQVMDTSLFSATFSNLLALALAVRICMPISQDKALASVLDQRYLQEQRDVWESEANVGNDYRMFDEDPDNDTFVNPGGWYASEDDTWRG